MLSSSWSAIQKYLSLLLLTTHRYSSDITYSTKRLYMKQSILLRSLALSSIILAGFACSPSNQKASGESPTVNAGATASTAAAIETMVYDPSKYVDYYKGADYSKSHLKQLERNLEIPSTVEGKLLLDLDGRSHKYDLTTAHTVAEIKIDVDEDEVYDVNKTSYECRDKGLKLNLGLYGLAQEVEIKLNDIDFSLSTIDGACDVSIRGLEISFEQTPDGKEVMTATVTKDIGLYSHDTQRVLMLRKGSHWRVTTPLPKTK